VSYEKEGASDFTPKAPNQRQHLSLHCNVKRGCRFVREHQGRHSRNGDGQHHPLPLPSGHFVWKGPEAITRVGNANGLQ
jgi:hypothetical protein